MLQLELYSKVFTLHSSKQYLSKTMFKKFAVLCAMMMFSSSVAAAYEPPPVPDSMTSAEIRHFLDSLKPTPAPVVELDITKYSPWSDADVETFSQMLYDAAKSDGNWDNVISDEGLRVITNCVTNYYSEKISFQLALVYYERMSPTARSEFNVVLRRCSEFALENENSYI